jgi:hypothetical protein
MPPAVLPCGETAPDVEGAVRPVSGAGWARVAGVARVGEGGAGGCVACGGVVGGGAGIAERGAGAVVMSPSPGVIGPSLPGTGIDGSGCDSVGGGAPGVVCAVSGAAATLANNIRDKARRFIWASFPDHAPSMSRQRAFSAFGCAAHHRLTSRAKNSQRNPDVSLAAGPLSASAPTPARQLQWLG